MIVEERLERLTAQVAVVGFPPDNPAVELSLMNPFLGFDCLLHMWGRICQIAIQVH